MVAKRKLSQTASGVNLTRRSNTGTPPPKDPHSPYQTGKPDWIRSTGPFVPKAGTDDLDRDWVITVYKSALGADCFFEFYDSGRYGFTHRIEIKNVTGGLLGQVLYGGRSQRNKIMLELTGSGCNESLCRGNLPGYIDTLEAAGFTPTRIDCAVDLMDGQIRMGPLVEHYHSGAFDRSGNRPFGEFAGDWLSPDASLGRTFYIGTAHAQQKIVFYEKGKQLGDPKSPWVRCELRLFKKQNSPLTWASARNPSGALAECVPYIAHLLPQGVDSLRCESIAKEKKLGYALGGLRNQYGKIIAMLQDELGWSTERIVANIRRDTKKHKR